MSITYQEINPGLLIPNKWNSNKLSPEAELKLFESISRTGLFKPTIVRKLANDELEILGGQHRTEQAIRVGLKTIPVLILENIDDKKAKEISLVDNVRYGQDDVATLTKLLADIGSTQELASFTPYDMNEITAMLAVDQINLDDIGFNDDEEQPIEPSKKPKKTHSTLRFKVSIENQNYIEKVIKNLIDNNNFDDSDSDVNAGDALMLLIKNYVES